MKIGYEAKRAFHNLRGLGSYNRTIIESMIKESPDARCFLYTPYGPCEEAYQKFHSYSQVRIRHPETTVDKYLSSYWRSYRLYKQVITDQIDIFHGLSHELPFGLAGKVRTAVTIHDLIPWLMPDLFSFFDRNIYKKKIIYATRVADVIITISEKTKKDLIDILKVKEDKIKVLYQSIHPRFYRVLSFGERKAILSKYGQEDGFMLAVGALEERKNIIYLLTEYASLKNRPPLVVVGRGRAPYVKQLKKVIADKQISSSVSLLQNVTNEDMPALYQAASLFCHASLAEGFGLPIVEALVSGVAVVSSHSPACVEVGGERTLYFSPYKKGDLADKIQYAFTHSSARKAMIDHGIDHAKRFSPETIARNLRSLYQSLL